MLRASVVVAKGVWRMRKNACGVTFGEHPPPGAGLEMYMLGLYHERHACGDTEEYVDACRRRMHYLIDAVSDVDIADIGIESRMRAHADVDRLTPIELVAAHVDTPYDRYPIRCIMVRGPCPGGGTHGELVSLEMLRKVACRACHCESDACVVELIARSFCVSRSHMMAFIKQE